MNTSSTRDEELHRSPGKSNRKWAFILTIFTVCIALGIIIVLVVVLVDTNKSSPMPKIQQEYQEKATLIIKYCTEGAGKGKAYDWVANISDTFGHRKIGSEALERAIDSNVEQFKNEYGLTNVHTENATLPSWIRGYEEAYMIYPRVQKLTILGLGGTVGTNGEYLEADAVVVTSFDELAARCNSTDPDYGVKNKMVVFNEPWDGTYEESAVYRGNGASEAAKCGAKAALIRSAESFSINSPHTGQQYYQDGVEKIPAISLTTEDAELLWRLQLRKQTITIRLNITSHNEDEPIISRNTIFELPGAVLPNEMVMLSGHFDSWDVGAGTMDNGAGASVALRAIVNLKEMIDQGLLPRPKRTIRGIFWTAEEPGLLGSQQYFESHVNDTDEQYVFLQEADTGFFLPLLLSFSGSPAAKTMFQNQIFPMLQPLNLTLANGEQEDSDWWAQEGIPGIFLASTGVGYERYFAFHHSEGDTPTVYKRNDLDVPVAVWAVAAYVVADMNETLPIGQRPQDPWSGH
jgi:carboxypeptidase Q